MSEFIVSFVESSNPKPKMKFHAKLHRNQWSLYPIPFVNFYFETCHPDAHVSIWKNKICGVYLSMNWLKYTYNIGFHKTIN
jgi:hypothetical protein